MHRWLWLPLVVACTEPESVAYRDSIEAWAGDRFTLSSPRSCAGLEQTMFGARGATCWSAKSKTEQLPAGSRMFPRVEIIVADYGTPDAAMARLGRFRDTPSDDDPSSKAYPLRAGFRAGHHVIVVTTDAYAFAADVDRVAAELARHARGTDLTCWSTCVP